MRHKNKQDLTLAQQRLINLITQHVGRDNAISGADILASLARQYPASFVVAKDTRSIRLLVEGIRLDPQYSNILIAAAGGLGYFIPATLQEALAFTHEQMAHSITTWKMLKKFERQAIDYFGGQTTLTITGDIPSDFPTEEHVVTSEVKEPDAWDRHYDKHHSKA